MTDEESLAHRQQFACDVCGNWPNEEGELEHGDGCYTQDENGGGSEWIEEAVVRRESQG